MAIYFEAGHNINDTGAVEGSLVERDITIDFKKRLRSALERGLKNYPKAKVYYDDDSWSLATTIANFKKTITNKDLTLSFHINSSDNKTATGSETFISDVAGAVSKELAQLVNDSIVSILKLKNRGVKKESESNRTRLGILNMKGAAALCEPVFISNKNDMATYEQHKDCLAEAIALHLISLDKRLNPSDYGL